MTLTPMVWTFISIITLIFLTILREIQSISLNTLRSHSRGSEPRYLLPALQASKGVRNTRILSIVSPTTLPNANNRPPTEFSWNSFVFMQRTQDLAFEDYLGIAWVSQ